MAILAMIYVVDEITALIGTQMQPDMAEHLFDGRLSILSLCSAFSLPLMAASMVYKTLADRYGRKLFLCINTTLGMGAGLFLTFLAGRVGAFIGGYYSAGDIVNSIMVSESAPTNLRASITSAVNVMSVLGGMIGAILPLIILFATGDNVRVLGAACIAVTVPVLAATIFFLFRKIGDTTHVDLNTVRGDEWDD